LCGFVSATVWAGVNALHCPITCPNRRKQPERYVPLENYCNEILTKINNIGIINIYDKIL